MTKKNRKAKQKQAVETKTTSTNVKPEVQPAALVATKNEAAPVAVVAVVNEPLVKIPNIILDNFEFNYWYTFLPVRDFLRHTRVNKMFLKKLNTKEMWHMFLVRDNHARFANLNIASTSCPTLVIAKKTYSDTKYTCSGCKQVFTILQMQAKEYTNVCQYHKGPYERAGGRADTVERGRWECCGAYEWYDNDPSPNDPGCIKTVHKFQ